MVCCTEALDETLPMLLSNELGAPGNAAEVLGSSRDSTEDFSFSSGLGGTDIGSFTFRVFSTEGSELPASEASVSRRGDEGENSEVFSTTNGLVKPENVGGFGTSSIELDVSDFSEGDGSFETSASTGSDGLRLLLRVPFIISVEASRLSVLDSASSGEGERGSDENCTSIGGEKCALPKGLLPDAEENGKGGSTTTNTGSPGGANGLVLAFGPGMVAAPAVQVALGIGLDSAENSLTSSGPPAFDDGPP